jgi:hypothetical protein
LLGRPAPLSSLRASGAMREPLQAADDIED